RFERGGPPAARVPATLRRPAANGDRSRSRASPATSGVNGVELEALDDRQGGGPVRLEPRAARGPGYPGPERDRLTVAEVEEDQPHGIVRGQTDDRPEQRAVAVQDREFEHASRRVNAALRPPGSELQIELPTGVTGDDHSGRLRRQDAGPRPDR